MNIREIKELIEFINDKNIAELEIDKAGLKLRIKTAHAVSTLPASSPSFTSSTDSHSSYRGKETPDVESTKESSNTQGIEESSDLHIIYSPIVGTFYRAPSPDSEPFVDIGSLVSPGTVLCIIEAMKLMNEIESDITGEVIKIHQENGKPVEFGQPLFSLKRKS
ncbi:MAG: acetyl-CoA carboxylase biotin carboxyl carrier protein [Acidobacteriota bacterium]